MHVTGPVLYMVIGVFGELGVHVQRHVTVVELVVSAFVMTQRQPLTVIHVLVKLSSWMCVIPTPALVVPMETVLGTEPEMKLNTSM